jgi:hypothetical protein
VTTAVSISRDLSKRSAAADQDYNVGMQQVGYVSWTPLGLADFGIPSESLGVCRMTPKTALQLQMQCDRKMIGDLHFICSDRRRE